MSLAQRILDHHFNLRPDWELPPGVGLLYPYGQEDTRRAMRRFYERYYDDDRERVGLFGINPGRFGAGVTGVPFTDPIRLETVAGIPNGFDKKPELSAQFVYAFIERFGGLDAFCRSFYISSLCPLGFVREGRNYNYYDDKELLAATTPHVLDHLRAHLGMGVSRKVAFSMGKGKNMAFFERLNEEHRLFDRVVALPHPRWVMQYRRRSMDTYLDLYVGELRKAAPGTP